MNGLGAASDIELLRAWRAGDAAAANALTQRHYTSVRRFFDLKVTHLAEDLTQQTFLAAVEGVERYRAEAGFRAYLFGIARLQLLRVLRKQGRHEHAMRFAGAETPGVATSLSVVAARREEHKVLLMALTQLPTDLQIVVELFYWEGMPTAEIGAVLETNPSTITSRLARAREQVHQLVLEMTRPGRLRESLMADLDGWQRSLGPLTANANANARR
ncbi:RNA polymerase sigma factor [Paraliomyxa miuraensis]|uniref:RNA polymerase sigma factor n=1 Tax=Paraliomyxa miuraensis TaxID=376150 RepID=UPI0022512AF7|nr:sigma-70 family RNA polymerase sigma factor [Paraliomyxa miuraensis]MCX4247989.1 sigma-70 family RNA polymerase sigma factor [Paraliomyxa miuraensis]